MKRKLSREALAGQAMATAPRLWRVFYCVYDPGGFMGYRSHGFYAHSFEEAEAMAHAHLESLAGKGKWEYVLFAEGPPTRGPRVYDTKERKRL